VGRPAAGAGAGTSASTGNRYAGAWGTGGSAGCGWCTGGWITSGATGAGGGGGGGNVLLGVAAGLGAGAGGGTGSAACCTGTGRLCSGTVPHGCSTLPGCTVTGWEDASPPASTVTVVVPALYAQNRPECSSAIGLPCGPCRTVVGLEE